MKHRSLRLATAVAMGVLGASVLAVAPAEASTNFSSNTFDKGMRLPGCTGYSVTGSTGSTAPANAPLAPNAAPTTTSWAGSNTLTETSTPSNVATQTWSMRATASATTSGAIPKSVNLSWAANYSLTAPAGATCSGEPDIYTSNNFAFTTTTPLLVTMTYHKSAHSYAETYIESSTNNGVYEDVYGEGLSGTQTNTVYLPAGTYDGYVEGDLEQRGFGTGSLASTGSANITFAVPGSAVSGPSGRAAAYVAMAKSVTCSTGSLHTTITRSLTYEHQISRVVYAVNGRVVRQVYGTGVKPGLAVNLTGIRSTSTTRAVVTVYLKNGTHVSEAATYRPCTV